MLDLSNIFNKDLKKAIISKEKLAEMLRVTPEALKAFEKSYQLHSMNEPISDNLFKVNAKGVITLVYIEGDLDSDDLITILFTKKDL